MLVHIVSLAILILIHFYWCLLFAVVKDLKIKGTQRASVKKRGEIEE